jgi:hypothetical protein
VRRAAPCGCPCRPGRPSARRPPSPRVGEVRRTAWQARKSRSHHCQPLQRAQLVGKKPAGEDLEDARRSLRQCLIQADDMVWSPTRLPGTAARG